MPRALVTLAPAVWLALTLFLLRWIAGSIDFVLPLTAVAVFLAVLGLRRLVPWTRLLVKAEPRSPFFTAVLFLLFVWHFVQILGEESHRMLVAQRLAAPRWRGPGWIGSLAGAVAGVFRLTLIRAERFYAAQALRGLGQ